jgi:hypothetical protein
MNNIDKTIKDLKASPLFYLFLSSRELFHSNFWFWLYTLKPIETAKLFSEKVLSNTFHFKREHNQQNGKPKSQKIKSKIDLYIYDEKEILIGKKSKKEITPLIVIENKVKDFPKHEQLKRIRDSFEAGHDNIEFILTTLFWKEEIKENIASGWNVRTYRNIAEAIEPSKFTDKIYYLSLIADYKEFTLNLALLAESIELEEKYDFYYPESKYLFDKLNDINLWEGYQKLRASHLIIEFEKKFKQTVHLNYGINNQKATMDFRPFLNLKSGYSVGIQIEGNQYRKFVEGQKAADFADNLLNRGVFLDSNKKFEKGVSYLKYGNSFKYQYDKITAVESFADLFKRIDNDINFIIKNKKYIEDQIPSS